MASPYLSDEFHESHGVLLYYFHMCLMAKLCQFSDSYDLVYNWFNYPPYAGGHHIIAYTIRLNHVHALIALKTLA